MTAPRGGSSAATVAHWGDRIFLLTAVPLGVSDDEVHQYRGALPERDVHQYLVLAIDRRDGRIVWERVAGERQPHEPTHASSGTYASSSAITDGEQVVTNGWSRIRSYDLETGEELWYTRGLTPLTIPSPVAGDGMVYAMSGFNGAVLKAISLVDARGDTYLYAIAEN